MKRGKWGTITLGGGDLDLDGGVTAGIEDLSGVDLGDGHSGGGG